MEKNLPIKIILPRSEDKKPNTGGGKIKLFCDVTPELQENIASQFDYIDFFYGDVFKENELVPAVGKITVKNEAIAKSHKPNELCRYCDIIGGEDLDEIYIKVTKKTIQETVHLIKNIPSQKFAANLTTIESVLPITSSDKISQSVYEAYKNNTFTEIKDKIKLKWFDFDNDFDNNQIQQFILGKLDVLGFEDKYDLITYGDDIKYLKIQVSSYDDILRISAINGVKSIDFFKNTHYQTVTS